MLPDGWKLTTLGKVCEGDLQTGPFGSQLHAHEYQEEGVPVLMPKDIINCRADISNAAKISKKRASDLHKHRLLIGDLLFSRRGDVARFALIDDKTEGSLCGTGCLKARPSKNHSPIFLSYILQKNTVKTWLEQNAVGQTMPNMNTAILNELPLISASSREEEDKIAKILSTWDKAIEKLDALIAAKQKRKKALMQQLLTGKMRFAGFEGEWQSNVLGEVAEIVMGSSPKSEAYNEIGKGLPLLQGNADIKNRLSAPRIYTTEITKECSPGDILMSVRAPVGAIARSLHKACIGRGIAALKAKIGLSQDFLYQWMLFFEPKWDRLSQGSTFESVNSVDIKNLHILLPVSFKEQQKIASVLSAADSEIETHQKQMAALKQQKKGLMQQLLTGKKRVIIDGVAA